VPIANLRFIAIAYSPNTVESSQDLGFHAMIFKIYRPSSVWRKASFAPMPGPANPTIPVEGEGATELAPRGAEWWWLLM